MKNRFKIFISQSFLISFVLFNSVISSRASDTSIDYPFGQPLDGMIAAPTPTPWDIIRLFLLPFSIVVGFVILIVLLIKKHLTKKSNIANKKNKK